MIMNSSIDGGWIIPFQKFSQVKGQESFGEVNCKFSDLHCHIWADYDEKNWFYIIGVVTTRDLVDGHREKTLSFLWTIILHYQVAMVINVEQIKEEIQILERSLRLKKQLHKLVNLQLGKIFPAVLPIFIRLSKVRVMLHCHMWKKTV